MKLRVGCCWRRSTLFPMGGWVAEDCGVQEPADVSLPNHTQQPPNPKSSSSTLTLPIYYSSFHPKLFRCSKTFPAPWTHSTCAQLPPLPFL